MYLTSTYQTMKDSDKLYVVNDTAAETTAVDGSKGSGTDLSAEEMFRMRYVLCRELMEEKDRYRNLPEV